MLSLIASVAAKGRVAAFSRESYGCWGGGVGLGFGNCYQAFPGGIEGFCGFLAHGNSQTEAGRQIASQVGAASGLGSGVIQQMMPVVAGHLAGAFGQALAKAHPGAGMAENWGELIG